METRKPKKIIKEKMGLGTLSLAELEQECGSGSPVATESTQVSPIIMLYGDREGLEHPQLLQEKDNTGEQKIKYSDTENLGEQVISWVQVNSDFQHQITETSHQDATRI